MPYQEGIYMYEPELLELNDEQLEELFCQALDGDLQNRETITFMLSKIIHADKFIEYLIKYQDHVTSEIIDTLRCFEDSILERIFKSTNAESLKAFTVASFHDEGIASEYIDKCSNDEELLYEAGMYLTRDSLIIKIIMMIHFKGMFRPILAKRLEPFSIEKYLDSEEPLSNKCFLLRYCPYDELKMSFLTENIATIPKFQIDGLIDSISDESIKSRANSLVATYKEDVVLKKGEEEECETYDAKEDALPPELRFGIELEASGTKAKTLARHGGYLFGKYEIKEENTIEDGVEFTSEIFHFCKEDIISIYKICNYIKCAELNVDFQCAGHIHYDALFLDCRDAWYYFFYIYSKVEKILFIISNREGTSPRPFINLYSKPFSSTYSENFEDLKSKVSIEEFLSYVIEISVKKVDALNVTNFFDEKKKTVEIRMPNGDDDADVIVQNIILFGNMFVLARKLSRLPMSEDLYTLLRAFDRAEDEKEVFEIFLRMIFRSEKNREVFRKRYEANKPLFDGSPVGEGPFKSFKLFPKEDDR